MLASAETATLHKFYIGTSEVQYDRDKVGDKWRRITIINVQEGPVQID